MTNEELEKAVEHDRRIMEARWAKASRDRRCRKCGERVRPVCATCGEDLER